MAAAALAGNGGLAPPNSSTESGDTIRFIYWVVTAACAVVFLLIETALILFIIRFRRRRDTAEDVEGPQNHGNTRLEILWTAIPALALAALAVFTIVKTPDVLANASGQAASDTTEIRVDGHQFYWQYTYPNGAISFDTLYLPVGKTASLELHSKDVNHSWWVPELTGKLDAIPGHPNTLDFEPARTGTYRTANAPSFAESNTRSWTRPSASSPKASTGPGSRTTGPATPRRPSLHSASRNGPPQLRQVPRARRLRRHRPIDPGQRDLAQPGRLEAAAPKRAGRSDHREPHAAGRRQLGEGAQFDALIAYVKSNQRLSTSAAPGEAKVADRTESIAPTWTQGAVTSWLTTVDHKRIGSLYIVTSFVFFFAGGVMAILMRLQLAQADQHLIEKNSYNELFTIHGTTMIFLFAVPLFAGFADSLVPLMIGARDMAFPRLNALSYWLFLLGGLVGHLKLPGRRRCRQQRVDGLCPPSRATTTAPSSARTCGSSASI